MTAPILLQSERDALILDARKYADRYALKIARRAGYYDRIDDIRAEAMLGVVDASRRFDPSRGVRFSTFAAFYIRLYCTRYIDEYTRVVRPPRGSEFTTIKYRVRPTEERLTRELQRCPTIAEMAAAIGCSEQTIIDARWRRPDVVVAHGDYEEGFYMVRDREPDPSNAVADDDARRYLAVSISEAFRTLRGRERGVIVRRFFSDPTPTLAEIGKEWGISRERVRQIEAKALEKMRGALDWAEEELAECMA